MVQDISKFSMPKNFRGKSVIVVQLWWVIQKLLFNNTPQFMYGFRRVILRFFGAKIGKNVLIRPTVRVTYPWKLFIGDDSWVGDDVVLYSLGEIHIGANSVVSQNSYLCAGDHDYNDISFPIRARPIYVKNEVWIATDCYIAPGVTINDGCVVGARSSVFKDMPAYFVCMGTPCKPIKKRVVS